ncbi:MAG: hypothetical protein ACC652_06155 [Acidimicrobiales bacterium]
MHGNGVLAELEVRHSRPIAPTRRVALGKRVLPVDPAPGAGAVLLAGIVARFLPEVDESFHDDYLSLLGQLEKDAHTPQPRLRHRFQRDTVGLTCSVHRLEQSGGYLHLRLQDDKAAPEQHVLAAAYAAGKLTAKYRPSTMSLMRRAEAWVGPTDASLIAYLTGRDQSLIASANIGDPVGWALGTLGFEQLTIDDNPHHRLVQQRFRDLLRTAHPDTGGAHNGAARRIADLSEARRILLS